MFKQIDSSKRFPELEGDVIEFWKKNKIFEKSVESRSVDNLYVFYDGPPFVSGLPHIGHLVVSTAKDVIPRFWTMKGKRVERVWGWDAHGLTVESKVQKKLGIKMRRDIESYGLEEFINECYVYTSETSAEWDWYIDKLGRWVDMENAYKTTDQNYMESVMWAFKRLYDKGLIYQGVRTSLFCTTCGTPVSNFEIAMDNTYKEVEDPAVTIKFKVSEKKSKFHGAFILAWTTTPWTLPSNRALVVNEDEKYVLVESNKEKFIVAKKRLEPVFEGVKYSELEEFSGKKLIGLYYEPLFEFFNYGDNDFKVYSFENMANTEEGTGIVHSAPGFGEIDTEMGRKYDLEIMLKIDDEGKFVAGDKAENPYEGMFYVDANPLIMRDLEARGLVFKDEKSVHRFPFHDRCDTLLIQKAQKSWFVDVTRLKEDLHKNNEGIKWVPEHLKDGRFKLGIEQAPDWCISRNRFWATPMPVWISDDGDVLVFGSKAEIEDASGQKVENLHRPFIDRIVINKDGKEYNRVPDVLDSWFEAGSMPYAQIHYPFENQEKFEKNFPGDFIVEYIAQTRAWFYVMHVLSTALFESNAFENVIGYGVLAGNDGRKMSKTYGNYTDPREIFETIGGDALRLYMMGSPLMYGDNTSFDEVELKTKSKRILNPLWNCVKFFVTYANTNGWDLENFVESDNELDIWIKARLKQLHKSFESHIEDYLLPPAVEEIESFVDDLSRWYVRRSRDRVSSGDFGALSTLYYVLSEFSKVTAPMIPFITENIYQYIVVPVDSTAMESVHLCDYPKQRVLTSEELEVLESMNLTREVVAGALAFREQKSIKIRQPLDSVIVSKEKIKPGQVYENLVCEEVNTKGIKWVDDREFNSLAKKNGSGVEDEVLSRLKESGVIVDTVLSEELLIEGYTRELIRKLQNLRKKNGLVVTDEVDVIFEDTEENRKAVLHYGDEISTKVQAKSLTPGDKYEISKKD